MTHRRPSARRFLSLALCVACVLAFSTGAGASLIGDDVRLQISVLDTTFEVVSGTDPDYSYSSYSWNVESTSFVFWIAHIPNATLPAGVSFTLSDLDFSPPAIVVDATIVSATGLFAGAMDDILTVGDDSIVVDLDSFAGGSLEGSKSMEISLLTEVPEPAAVAMLIVGGAAMLGGVRVRRRPWRLAALGVCLVRDGASGP
jgi:hypothetical protein